MQQGSGKFTMAIRSWLAGVLALVAYAAPAQAEAVRIARQFGISYLPLILMQDAGLLEAEGRARGLDAGARFSYNLPGQL